jgi:hypothetical protein
MHTSKKPRANIFSRTGIAVLLAGLPLIWAATSAAESGNEMRLAQAASPSAAPAGQGIDQQINDLRTRLQITPAQQGAFDAFAQVMRQNAQEMDALIQRQSANRAPNAVEELRASAAAAAAEASGLQRLVPAFQTLYNGLSEQQKRTADQLFAGPPDTGDAPTKK